MSGWLNTVCFTGSWGWFWCAVGAENRFLNTANSLAVGNSIFDPPPPPCLMPVPITLRWVLSELIHSKHLEMRPASSECDRNTGLCHPCCTVVVGFSSVFHFSQHVLIIMAPFTCGWDCSFFLAWPTLKPQINLGHLAVFSPVPMYFPFLPRLRLVLLFLDCLLQRALSCESHDILRWKLNSKTLCWKCWKSISSSTWIFFLESPFSSFLL